MSTAVELDDEMEAMLREIEGMGMTPEAPVPATAAPAAPAPKAEAPTPAVPAAAADEEMAALEAMLNSDIEDIGDSPDTSATGDIDDMADIDAAVAAIEAEHKPAPALTPEPAEEKKVSAVDVAKARLKAEGFIEPAAAPAPAAKIEPDYTEPDNEVKVKPTPAAAPKTEAPKRAAAASSSTDILDPDQIKRDIAINPTDLDSALIEHPGLQLHYALKTADARRAYERLKSGVEILEAQLDSKYREELFDGGKKPTEAAIRNAVVGDPKYAAAQAKLIDAQHLWKMCEAVESSFHSRKDILLEVARDRRKEKEGAMRVMEESDLRGKVDAMMRK